MRITLLRAPTDPDPEADQGAHELRYAILPTAAAGRRRAWSPQARAFAEPLIAAAGAGAFAQVDDPALVLDSIKRAEDSDALILRLYEAHGGRGTARIRSACRSRAPAGPTCWRAGRGAPVRRRGDRARLPAVGADHDCAARIAFAIDMDLDAAEVRVLGCLIEKQRTTPDVYPLSLNGLRTACNQSTNRDPVVAYDDDTLRDALHGSRAAAGRAWPQAPARPSTATCSTRSPAWRATSRPCSRC